MAESAINFLLNQISIWLREETKLLRGLDSEAQLIYDELEQMKVFLRVADAKEEADPQLKVLVRQIREIAYDVEDVLETYMLRSSSHGSHGIKAGVKKLYALIKNLNANHHVASKIKELRYRAENISKKFKDMHEVLDLASSSIGIVSDEWYDGRSDALLLEEVDIVGIERPKKQLLEWILASDYTFKVVSVVGMAGLGKTTLVKKLYDDPWVKQGTDHRVWFSVSETYKIESLLQDLIKQLLKEMEQPPPVTLESMNADGMRDFIYNFLQNKNFIIILDDVWRANVWEALRLAFPRNNTHGQGCIVITSRFMNIGDYACCESGGNVYNLQPLSANEARLLFNRKAFQQGSCPHHLVEISNYILRRCGGLPLAIVVIGGVLATKGNDIEEWKKFSRNLGSELEGDNLKRMRIIISLSYYDLPYYLKTCLLFLSIFPEDQLLEKATIIRLWIAEGLVETTHGKFEIAEGYLNELSNRNLIQVVACKFGKPRNFCIHDLVREYIVSRATEQNLTLGQSKTTWDAHVRRLGLKDSFVGHVDQINNFKRLRTLLFFGSDDMEWRPVISKVLGGDCRMLKELDLRGATLDAIPNEVFKLYRLKYLSLRNTNVSVIPKLIGKLENLETLDLKRTKVIELPMEILKLRRLQCLLVYKYKYDAYHSFDNVQSFKASYEIGQLVCLQKLSYIDASARGERIKIVSEIGRLTKLQRLGIENLRKEDGKEFCSSLANLTSLSSLNISSLDENEVIDLQYDVPPTLVSLKFLTLKGRLEKVPQWIPSLIALTRLSLRWSKLDEDPLECLQGLPNLQNLEISFWAYKGEGLNFKSAGFQSLKKLYLQSLMGLKWVGVEKGSMPSLETFIITNCKAMVKPPMGIEHLTNLIYVRFKDMTQDFVKNLEEEKKREENQWKLSHVPIVIIADSKGWRRLV